MTPPTCSRCLSAMLPEPMWDLPRKVREFFCLHCGERFWVQVVEPQAELEPLRN